MQRVYLFSGNALPLYSSRWGVTEWKRCFNRSNNDNEAIGQKKHASDNKRRPSVNLSKFKICRTKRKTAVGVQVCPVAVIRRCCFCSLQLPNWMKSLAVLLLSKTVRHFFTGSTSSGESQIRRWLLENDLLEAIIAMPTDLFYNTGIASYWWLISKNKRPERKGYVQLIDATNIYHKLRKPVGNKKNEFSPEDRAQIAKLYTDFDMADSEYSKIFKNEDFMYREYAVMQPLQRSYAITEASIERMLQKGALKGLWDEAKVAEYEEQGNALSGKDENKLKAFYATKPVYDAILAKLQAHIVDEKWLSPKAFTPVLTAVLGDAADKKTFEKIMDGLSVMDKTAEIQRDKKGNIIYDKETKDTELVKYTEDIETYMAREVLPHIPDAKWFWEEDLTKKKPVIKTGAEIPFTRYFYKYKAPKPSAELLAEFLEIDKAVNERVARLLK